MTKPTSEMTEEEVRQKREYFRLYAAKLRSDPEWKEKNNAKRRASRAENVEDRRKKDRDYKATRKEHFEAYDKEWKAKNRNRYLTNRKNWNAKNRDKTGAYAKGYWKKNKDEIEARRKTNPKAIAYRKEYKAKNRAEIRVKGLEYYYQQRDLMETDRAKRMRCIAMSARTRAKAKRGAYEDGCCDEFIANPPDDCLCCGQPLDYNTKGRNPFGGPSLDKVDNDLGYIKCNVAIICRRCNTAKSDRKIPDFIRVIKYIQRFDRQPPTIDYYGVEIPATELYP
jgi:hypothetical protein